MSLTEGDAVRRAIERAPLGEAIEGLVTVQRGAALNVSAYPNPVVSYWREQTFGSLGTREDYASIAQIVDLANRRGLRGEAGDARARAAIHEGSALRRVVAAEARLRFGDALHRDRRARALELWIERIAGALSVVERRTARGDAAIYDRRRLERERIAATGRLETERAAEMRALARLRAILGEPTSNVRPSGALLPDADLEPLASLRLRALRRPELLALEARQRAGELDRKAASRWWIPELRLEGGYKGVDVFGQGRTDGFLAGAALVLPLWDRSRGLRLSGDGESRATRGQRHLALVELDGELSGLHAEAARLRHAAVTFRSESHAASTELVRIANAGYAGGEMTVLELLDAYRGAVDDELTALDMELAARRARVELDRVAGPPEADGANRTTGDGR